MLDISQVILNVSQYEVPREASYIALPVKLKNTQSLINQTNEDHYCFYWVILAYFYTISDFNYTHPERITKLADNLISKYKLNFKNIKYPATVENIKRFEHDNSHIKIQLYTCEADSDAIIYPLHVSYYKPEQYTHVINLLLITSSIDEIIENTHYLL